MRRFFMAVPIAMLVVGGSTACATKKFVRTSVGEVNDKVDSLGKSVEETQERTRRNEGRISEVDQKAQAADQKAQAAGQSAQQANTAAAQANTAAGQAASAANVAGSKADAIDKASRRLVYEVVLSEDQGNFKFGKTTLPDEAKQKIDEMVAQLKQDPKNIYLEIEGHTDNIGAKMINEKIGLERAQAVQRYLYEQYQVPLHKMNIISYGQEKPVAPNKTKEGRAQNRRVVIKVLA
jgi:peptidoglycan-associated lipoprotein